jgi:histidine ammonia-lyase
MIELTGNSLTIEQITAIARGGERVAPLGEATCERMEASHRWVMETVAADEATIYGVNTGFGSLATRRISVGQARQLSRNVVALCCVGVGPALPEDVVRAIMVVRANMLAKGHSGVRPLLAQTLIDMLNAGVTPYVPEKGSLGASGDLAPLAHITIVMTRDETGADPYSGKAWYGPTMGNAGELLDGAEAMRRAGIERQVLEAKEGLALTNGIDFMAAVAALAVHDAETLLATAEAGAALSLEGMQGLSAAFEADMHAAAGQPGQQRVAARIRELIAGSSHVDAQPGRVQDAYSLRCTPQVLGPALDTVAFVRQRATTALNAATDNPLIFPTPQGGFRALSGGNFHGQGPSQWLDFLGIAMAEVANIAERRIFRMLTPELSGGLPAMLTPTSGLESGLMMVQYTAAALVSDNKTLAHPDSVDSIPSCANQEDHVSMGANAARHTLEILDNVRNVLAIELLTACQAIDLREGGAERLGAGTRAAYDEVRHRAALMVQDRETASDIARLAAAIRDGTWAGSKHEE